ncbi:MAG: HTTM domain-containing protein [Actinomycetota bacterium]
MNALSRAWERFWFQPESVATLAVVRIAFGIVAFFWTLSLAPDLMSFFGRRGFVPDQPSNRFWIGLLSPSAPAWLVYTVFAVTLVAAVCLVVGFRSRIASVLVFAGILSFQRRNPFIFNAGDVLVRNLAFYLMLAPSGVALSIDSLRHARDTFWEFPKRAPWALRLIQVQLSVVYVATVWAKVRGNDWNDGTAVSYALRLDDLARIRAPQWLATSEVLSNLMTFGTLAIEASLAILVWNRKARPWVLGAGILMHALIAVNIMIGFFTMAMLIAYMSFTPPDAMERFLAWARKRFARSGGTPSGDLTPAASGSAP